MPHSLSEEQAQLLAYLRNHRHAAISAPAASGKTTLAVRKATELDHAGSEVLFLCRNLYLAESLRQRLQGTGIQVFAFTELIRWLLENAQRPDIFLSRGRPQWVSTGTQYDVPSPSELDQAMYVLARLPKRFDAVLIDEGQDFEANWLAVAKACLSDERDGRFYVFFDDNPSLSHVSLKQMYAGILAPPVLTQNLRCAAPIAALVHRLHPDPPQDKPSARGEGLLREWTYATDAELSDHLRSALLDAEEFSPGLKDITVLTAETTPSRRSRFAGFVIDSPHLRAGQQAGGLHWQEACLRYLQGFGLLESDLSSSPTPTPADVHRVVKFSAAYQAGHRQALRRQTSHVDSSTLHWHMDSFGGLSLHWTGGDTRQLPAPDLLKFFGSPGWVKSLPHAQKRYRLTPVEDPSDHLYYIPVRLVDIPSFQGLEAGGVVFVLYNYFASSHDQLLATLYRAFSRARRLLYIISPSMDL